MAGIRSVVVGVDGTEGDRNAVVWAANEARLRTQPLRIVHACWCKGDRLRGARTYQILDEAVHHARSSALGVDVRVSLEEADPAALLERESHTASVVVLGLSEEYNAVTSTLLRLSTHLDVPLVVVPGGPSQAARTGPVAVFLDGPLAGEQAIRASFDSAARRRTAVLIVRGLAAHLRGGDNGEDVGSVLAEAIDLHPDIAVDARTLSGHPAALARLSESAALMVVRSRPPHASRGPVLGSVSRVLLQLARCPVMLTSPPSGSSPERFTAGYARWRR